MTEYIYGDVLFIINFSMDFLSLFIVGKIMHFRMSVLRMICAASIGAFYGVASLFIDVGAVLTVLIELFAALAICFVAHYHGSLVKFFGTTALFYGVSFALGGIMSAIYSKIGVYKSYIEIGGSINTVFGDIDFSVFVILAALSALFTFFIGRAAQRKLTHKFCGIKLTYAGKEYEFSGFFDTGNLISEPITGTPVIFFSSDAAEKIDGGALLFMSAVRDLSELGETPRGVRFIPLTGVSGGGVALAVRPEKFSFRIGKKYEERSVLISGNAAVRDFCGADALVPTEIV